MPITRYPSANKKYASTWCRGLTLVELLLVLVLIGVISAMAIPSYRDVIARQRVKAATEAVFGLMLQGKSEAPVRDARLSLTVNSDHWCVGLSEISPCDCTQTSGSEVCSLDIAGNQVLHTISGTEFPEVTLSENFPGVRTRFSHIRRNASPAGTITVSSRGQQLFIKISLTGRIRICTPPDSAISGYRAC